MANTTDPARELTDLCDRIASHDSRRGDDYLATAFGVSAWSQEFYQIIFCIIGRADFVSDLISKLDLDDDFRSEAIGHVNLIKRAFSLDAMNNPWHAYGLKQISKENIQPIKMLSSQIRQLVHYPKLDQLEIDEVLGLVNELEKWLNEHQLQEQDFIRQALLDGIAQFKFRMERIGWFGWGYTIASLREVIGAYLALDKAFPDKQCNPDAAAVLAKTGNFLKKFYEKAKFAKDVYQTSDFFLKMYGAATLTMQAASLTGVTALLTGSK